MAPLRTVRALSLITAVVFAACSGDGGSTDTGDRCGGVVCTASDSCHVSTCNPATGACVERSAFDTTPCDDGDPNSLNDACFEGRCVGYGRCTGVTCEPGDQCHEAGVCDPATGQCGNAPRRDGTTCDDGNPNTVQDACTAGVCAGISLCRPEGCSPSDQCHVAGTCDPQTGLCSNPAKPDGTACSDGNANTVNDACRGGVCTGTSRCAGVACTALSACHDVGICEPSTGLCSNPIKSDGSVCDDGDATTIDDRCVASVCRGMSRCSGVACVASDQCHAVGICDPNTGACSNPAKSDGATCDDGDAATFGDACRSGLCSGSAANGDTCAQALVIAAPYLATHNLAGFTNDYASGTGCRLYSKADRVFAVDVPAGKRLYASVRGLGTSTDPSLSVVGSLADCGTQPSCLASNDSGSAAALNFVTQTNGAAQSRRYYLIVDTVSTTLTGDIELRVIVTDPLPGDTCATAEAITLTNGAAALTGQTTDLYENDVSTGTGCSGFGGGERIYRLDVPAGATANLAATPESGFDLSLNLVQGAAGATPSTACGASMACVAGANAGAAGAVERLTYTNSGTATKTLFVTVEAATTSTQPGQFSLSVDVQAPAIAVAGDTCATLQNVVFNGSSASFTAQTIADARNDYGAGTGCVGTEGSERGYAVTIPAGKVLTVTATGSGFDPSLNAVSAYECGSATRRCITGGNVTGSTETITLLNSSALQSDVVVFVETAATSLPASATYSLSFALSDAAAGEYCGTAQSVGTGRLTGQALVGFTNDYGTGTSCVGTAGPDRFYTVVVPDGQKLTATVTPEGSGTSAWDPAINVMLDWGCYSAGRACVAGANSGGSGLLDTATWTNHTGASATVYIAVENVSSTAPASGTTRNFTLDVALAAGSAPPVGESCSNAVAISAGSRSGETLIGYSNQYGLGLGCAGEAGPERVYKIAVPAGQRLTATVTPKVPSGGTSWDPAVNLQTASACSGPRTCLAGMDDGISGEAETTYWVNTGASSTDVYVVVETYSTTTPGSTATRTFDLAVTLDTPPTAPSDEWCSDSSTRYAANASLSGQTMNGYLSNFSSSNSGSCDFYSGADRAIAVSIPSGKTLTATVTPDSSWDPTLGLVLGGQAACGANVICSASVDSGSAGAVETLTYTNVGAATAEGFLILDSYTTGAATYGYTLTLSLTP